MNVHTFVKFWLVEISVRWLMYITKYAGNCFSFVLRWCKNKNVPFWVVGAAVCWKSCSGPPQLHLREDNCCKWWSLALLTMIKFANISGEAVEQSKFILPVNCDSCTGSFGTNMSDELHSEWLWNGCFNIQGIMRWRHVKWSLCL